MPVYVRARETRERAAEHVYYVCISHDLFCSVNCDVTDIRFPSAVGGYLRGRKRLEKSRARLSRTVRRLQLSPSLSASEYSASEYSLKLTRRECFITENIDRRRHVANVSVNIINQFVRFRTSSPRDENLAQHQDRSFASVAQPSA